MIDKKTTSTTAKIPLKKPTAKKTTAAIKRKTIAKKPSKLNTEAENKLYVQVKYEQKNHFKTYFPEAIWQKGKGWAIDDTFSNQNKLDEWHKKSEELAGFELQEALTKLNEAFVTIVKKIEELDIIIKKKD